MRRLVLLWLCLLGAWPLVAQQVTVELVLERTQFLAGEDLNVAVKIKNFSGKTLKLGADPSWLRLLVEHVEDYGPVKFLGTLDTLGEFEVATSTIATRKINLTPAFDLSRPGRYRLSATVALPELGREVESNLRHFDITQGTKMWEQEVGAIPGTTLDGKEVDSVKYSLVQLTTLKQTKLYLRISDSAESIHYRTLLISTMVSFSKPEVQIDRANSVHILNQFGPRSFTYCVVSAAGEIVTRETYAYSDTRPKLRLDADGKLGVGGGVRRWTLADHSPKEETPEPSTPASIPASTPDASEAK